MPKLSGILCTFVLFLFAVAAHSQGKVVTSVQVGSGAQNGNGGSDSGAGNRSTGVIGGFISVYAGPGARGQKGLPFTADVIDETDKFLADGNHIHRESHSKIFRDSEGRWRSETEPELAGRTALVYITIIDPVAKVFISLDPQQKVATVHHFGENSGARTTPDAQAPVQKPTQRANDRQPPSFEDLGTMEIEGFTVKGRRVTSTIPAGSMGNDQPMIMTGEQWSSAELQTDLLFKSVDPESGQHVHRLLNIRAGDPDPLLFQVPADYTIKDSAQR